MTKTQKGEVDFEKAERIKERKREQRRLIFAVLLIFLTLYIVFSLIVVAFYYFSFRSGSKSQTLYGVETAKYVLKSNGSYKKSIFSSIDAETSNMGYGLYIGFDELNDLCDFSSAGNNESFTLIIRDTDEYAELFANSSFLYVNENPVRLSAPVLNKNGKYYIPMEFVEEYIIGIDVEYDKDEKLCTVSIKESKTPIGFKLKTQDSIPNVNIELDQSDESQ